MSDDSSNSAGLLAALLERRAVIERKRALVRARIARLNENDRALRTQYVELENAIHEAHIHAGSIALPTSAAPSPRNLGFLRSWAALLQAINHCRDPSGLPNYEAVAVIRRAVPGIRDATIRSHLHRLKTRGYLRKEGHNWKLTNDGALYVHKELDGKAANETS